MKLHKDKNKKIMHTKIQKNEQGFALVLELIVVALVLSAVSFGVYNYRSHTSGSAASKAPAAALTVANDVNSSLIKSASVDVNESTGADALGDELQSVDSASAGAEGGIDENSF